MVGTVRSTYSITWCGRDSTQYFVFVHTVQLGVAGTVRSTVSEYCVLVHRAVQLGGAGTLRSAVYSYIQYNLVWPGLYAVLCTPRTKYIHFVCTACLWPGLYAVLCTRTYSTTWCGGDSTQYYVLLLQYNLVGPGLYAVLCTLSTVQLGVVAWMHQLGNIYGC